MTVLTPTGGLVEALVIDPVSEDPTNTVLTLINPGTGIDVLDQSYPQPDRDRLSASGADVEGAPLVQSQYRNRTITLRVRCFGTHNQMRARLAELTTKVGKLARYGGTLQRTLANTDTIVFDVLDADLDVPSDFYMVRQNSAVCTLTLLCEPFGRGPTTSYSPSSETSLPELVFTVTSPLGDVPALGLLEVTEASGVDQAFVQWGLESHFYPGAAAGTTTAALGFSGVTRLAYNGSTALAVAGAVGGTVLNQATLIPDYTAVCSIASSGTVYPTHVGTYGVWARLYMGTANAGTVTAALEWSQADLSSYTRNDGTILDPTRKGQFLHAYLGHVRLAHVTSGVQRWDGRLIAKSDTGGSVFDSVAVDRLYMFPVLDGYGEARSVLNLAAPTTFNGRDEFNQTAGVVTGKTAAAGGVWAGAGGGTDFSVEITGHTLQRTTTTDAASQFAISGAAALTDQVAQVDMMTSAASNGLLMSIVGRYVDANNRFNLNALASPSGQVFISKTIAGVTTGGPGSGPILLSNVFGTGSWYTLRLAILADGRWFAYAGPRGNVALVGRGFDKDLVTGGTLASGKVAIRDFNPGTAATRNYDNFRLWVPSNPPSLAASRKLHVRHDQALRQDTAGTAFAKPGDYRGDYLKIPPAQFGGTARVIVKACRSIPEIGADAGIDDISAVLSVTPRYLQIPE